MYSFYVDSKKYEGQNKVCSGNLKQSNHDEKGKGLKKNTKKNICCVYVLFKFRCVFIFSLLMCNAVK